MPFTASHVVAVLPFAGRRRWLPFAPAALGSMAPDLGLFLGAEGFRDVAHSAAGVLVVDLPVVVVAGLLWSQLLRPALLALVPPLAVRWPDPAPLPGTAAGRAGWGLVWALAAVVGSASHVLLDAFTHRGGWGEAHLPALSRTWQGVAVVDWLQYLGSAVGLAVLVVVAAHWWRVRRPRGSAARTLLGPARLVVLTTLLAGCAAGALVRAAPAVAELVGAAPSPSQWQVRAVVTDLLVGGGATLAVLSVLVAVAVRVASVPKASGAVEAGSARSQVPQR